VALDRCLIWLGLRHRTVAVAGLRFRVRRLTADVHFVRDVVAGQEYTGPGYEIAPHDIAVDIGANIGAFAVYAASQARHGLVVAVEPVADSYRLLLENLRLNRCDHVRTRRAALAGHRAKVRVYLSPAGAGRHSIIPQLAQSRDRFEEVDGLTLADILDEYRLPRCDLLKLDCEGAEFEVLRSLTPELAQRVHRIALEYHTVPDRGKAEQSRELVERLREVGYTIDTYTDVVGTYWGTILARRPAPEPDRRRTFAAP
jgi:FkbM family methyltransferase